MKNRPVISLPQTTPERILDILAFTLAGISLLLAISFYPDLPEQIPQHFNGRGVADRFGYKFSIFILPGLSILMSAAFYLAARYPHKLNYPYQITPENAAFEYAKGRLLIKIVSALTNLLFLLLTWNILQLALGKSSALNPLFWVIVLAIVVVPIGMMYFIKPKS